MGVGGSASDPVAPSAGGTYTGCFEGPEKLLEVTFSCPLGEAGIPKTFNHSTNSTATDSSEEEGSNGIRANIDDDAYLRRGLRTVPRSVWEDMLRLVRAEIVSEVKNEHLDAYLLSESSLFIYPTRVVIKTCGTTTLLNALPRILEIAEEECNLSTVERCFYSRKNFLFPERQCYPHGSFQDEINFLDAIFEDGAAYTVGKLNGEHWNLYVTENRRRRTESPVPREVSANATDDEESEGSVHSAAPEELNDDGCDESLEILMTELDVPTARSNFYRSSYDSPCENALAKRSGINKLMPGSKVDAFLFDPCGYSANGLRDESFWTIHVTPEPHCSYASFETNCPIANKDWRGTTAGVLKVFRPGRFTVVRFVHRKEGKSVDEEEEEERRVLKDVRSVAALKEMDGYKRTESVVNKLPRHWLVYTHFVARA